jgi:MFS family permease
LSAAVVSPRNTGPVSIEQPESAYAWFRLGTALLLGTIGSVGMWSVVVALPTVQADFGVARADASLPYTLAMMGFGTGGIVMGRLADRFGIIAPVCLAPLASRSVTWRRGSHRASGCSPWRMG